MKNKFLLVISITFCFSFFCQTTTAQDVDELKKGNFYSFKLMLNSGGSRYKYTNGERDNEQGRIGYGVGFDYQKFFNEHTYFTIGGEINSRGYKASTSNGLAKVRATYLDLPITINHITGDRSFFSYHDKFLVGLGAYVGLGISGKYQLSNGSWTSLKFGESNTDNRSRLDYGWIFNFGYKTPGFPFLIFSLASGIKNVLPTDNHGAYDWRKLSCFKMYLMVPVEAKTKKKGQPKYSTYKKR